MKWIKTKEAAYFPSLYAEFWVLGRLKLEERRTSLVHGLKFLCWTGLHFSFLQVTASSLEIWSVRDSSEKGKLATAHVQLSQETPSVTSNIATCRHILLHLLFICITIFHWSEVLSDCFKICWSFPLLFLLCLKAEKVNLP